MKWKKQPSFEKTKWWCKRERGKIFGFSSLHAWLEKGKKSGRKLNNFFLSWFCFFSLYALVPSTRKGNQSKLIQLFSQLGNEKNLSFNSFPSCLYCSVSGFLIVAVITLARLFYSLQNRLLSVKTNGHEFYYKLSLQKREEEKEKSSGYWSKEDCDLILKRKSAWLKWRVPWKSAKLVCLSIEILFPSL